MYSFIGEHIAKLDAKGRVVFPAALKKQSVSAEPERFVLKKDIYEECLVLYTVEEWASQIELLRSRINPYNRVHARFMRSFFRGAAEIQLDSNNRMLLPKHLAEQVSIEKEICFAGIDSRIEIWAEEIYNAMDNDYEDFAELASEILGTELT